MDTRATNGDVSAKLEEIKTYMPETYQGIKARADLIGGEAYVYVRRGLRGEPNCFYAFEAGRVVGTPFNLIDQARDVAQMMVTQCPSSMCLWHVDSIKWVE